MIIKFALKNIRHTIDHLPIFLLSISFSIMVAFSFFMISNNSRVQKDLAVAVGESFFGGIVSSLFFIYYFIIFFILLFVFYSNNFFMQQKKRDIILLLLAGFSKVKITIYFMAQIFIIGLICLLSGIGLGFVFSRLIYMLLLKLMAVDIPPNISWNLNAANALLFWFVIAMLLLFINTIYHVTKTKVSFNIGVESKYRKIKERWWVQLPLGVSSFAFLLFELYHWAITIPKYDDSNVDLGLFFGIFAYFGLFKWTIPLVINVVKKLRLQNDVQLIWLNNLKLSIIQNSAVLTIITVTSIAALTIFSSLSYTYPYRQHQVQLNSPTRLSVTATTLPKVKRVTEKHHVQLDQIGQADVKVYLEHDGLKTEAWSFISLHDYNSFAEKMFNKPPVKLANNETIFLSAAVDSETYSVNFVKRFINNSAIFTGSRKLEVVGTSKFFPMGRYMYFSDTLVLSDASFARIKNQYEYQVFGYNLIGQINQKFKRAMTEIEADNTQSMISLNKDKSIVVANKVTGQFISSKSDINFQDQDNDQFKQVIGLAFFGFLFLGLLLILASGNLLLLKLQDSTFANIHDFRIYNRLGGTRKDLRRILFRQTSIFLFAPIIIALITNLSVLPVLEMEFKVYNYYWPLAVFAIYAALNGLFYYVSYRNLDSIIYATVIEKER